MQRISKESSHSIKLFNYFTIKLDTRGLLPNDPNCLLIILCPRKRVLISPDPSRASHSFTKKKLLSKNILLILGQFTHDSFQNDQNRFGKRYTRFQQVGFN